MHSKRPRKTVGLSLAELLTVLAIIGILAAIVAPRLVRGGHNAKIAAFVSDLEIFLHADEIYHDRTGECPVDASTGTLPDGWEAYVDAKRWTAPTPLGGRWDTERGDFGFTCGLGVHVRPMPDTFSDELMAEVDGQVDDGDLSTGHFRKFARDRFYWVVHP